MHGSRWFDGPAGPLDARLHGPPDGPAVLLLHPHPGYGGHMGSRLVYDLAEGLGEAGHRVVRFDFRGVGRSAGEHSDGEGEAEDAAAVWDAVAAESGPPAVVGFSFGGGVALRLAQRRAVPRLVLVATPLRIRDSALAPIDEAAGLACPVTVIVGDRDGFVPVEHGERLAAALGARLRVIAGAGHFLEPSRNPRAVAAVLEAVSP